MRGELSSGRESSKPVPFLHLVPRREQEPRWFQDALPRRTTQHVPHDSFLGGLLFETGYAPAQLFTDFQIRNPSFKGNTAATYITQISRFLFDWLFEFGDLPERYAPVVNGSRMAQLCTKADSRVPEDGGRDLQQARVARELETQCAELWRSASITGGRGSRRGAPEKLLACGERTNEQPEPLRIGISARHEAMLNWLLNRYQQVTDGGFWKHVLSAESVGKALLRYRQEGCSSATICLRMTAIQHLRTLVENKYDFVFEDLPMRQPRKAERCLPVIEASELEQVADYLRQEVRREGGYLSRRNELIYEIFCTTGIRVSELLNLREKDIDLEAGTIRVRAKGDKERVLPLFPETVQKMRIFSLCRERHLKDNGKKHGPGEAYFHTRLGNEIDRPWLFDIVRKMGKRAGLDARVGPHTLRRSLACMLYDEGAPLQAIQQLLGHRSIETTVNYYLRHGMQRVAEALVYHPWNKSSSRKAPQRRPVQLKIIASSPAERDDPAAPALAVRAERDFLGPNPGHLWEITKDHPSTEVYLSRYTRGKPALSPKSKKDYQKVLKHFLSDRFHDLDLGPGYEKVHRAVMVHYLTDRLDWLVRTGEITEAGGVRLAGLIASLRTAKCPILSHFPKRDRDTAKLLEGVDEYPSAKGGLALKLPDTLHLDSDKSRGIRVNRLIGAVFYEAIDCIDETFWREIFDPSKADDVMERTRLRGAQVRTIKNHMSCLTRVGECLKRNHKVAGEDGKNVVHFLPVRSAGPRRPQKVFTEGEVNAVYDVLNKRCETGDARALHDRALFSLMYTTLARGGDMETLQVSAIDFKRGEIYLQRKGEKEQVLPLHPDAKSDIEAYLPHVKGDFLFHAPRGGKLSVRHIGKMLTRVCEEAGIEITMRGSKNIGSHILRRSGAWHMANNGASLFDLQWLMNHENIRDTADYLRHMTIDLRDLQRKCHPWIAA